MRNIIYLLIVLSLLPFGCRNKDEGYLSKKIMSDNFKKIIISFTNDNPEINMFGLYFVKFSKQTVTYLLSTLPFKKETVNNNKPDEIVKINGKYILINLGFKNIKENEPVDYKEYLKEMEMVNSNFSKNEQFTFQSKSILIYIKNGEYKIIRGGINHEDNPMAPVKEKIIFMKPNKND